ncbi:DUF3558 family protein [Actinokineospora globicatena]|uniref:DUF3558 domain-containing protein n=1 Tax=Actinokineospora globicatena TaxID=103729 RepID=A0A9W6QPG1_9PSEU|nr:DUF3558 family protein [Actinokineospora globicatena]MCP2301529.1 Protein of unknown function (DUF3558) [Actinokineospora globicatena]GLW76824.1 hypothetical protein Aglo01_13060 [Actinokineospora globicatena]GLW83657.1 hypothetical protein Aglo02_12970 [Actinokineospora globicatena]GLW92395.1 hypothetical protein Aglo03_32110 [Actinokineospora globicatena]
MSRPWHVPAALLVALCAACSSQTAGTPVPAAGAPTGPTSTNRRPVPDPRVLQAAQPCELLPAAALRPLGITGAGKSTSTSKSRQCEWRVEKGTVAESYTIAVVIYESTGVADIKTDKEIEYLNVGEHEAARYFTRGTAGCALGLGITPTSRVDVQATGEDPEALCGPAMEAAKQVEPALP